MRSIYYTILIILFTSGCGFNVVNQSSLGNVSISNIETTGDKRIGFNIKKKLQLKTKSQTNNGVNIIINIERKKNIKEKNSNNEITKYLIAINLNIKVEKSDKTIKILSLSDKRDYNVSSQYSQTIVNENQAIKSLTDLLTAKIIKELSLINLNDL